MKGVGYGVAPFATFVPTIFVRGCHTRSGASTCAPHATSSPSARDADGKSTAAAVVATAARRLSVAGGAVGRGTFRARTPHSAAYRTHRTEMRIRTEMLRRTGRKCCDERAQLGAKTRGTKAPPRT